jgi:hypothetical protein
MRPLEAVLVLSDLSVFLLLVVRLPRRVRVLRHAVPVAGVAAGVQVLVEGQRWQLVPAYLLAGSLVLIWLVRTVRALVRADRTTGAAGATGARTWRRRVGGAAAVGVGAVVLIVSAAVPVAVPVFGFPAPGGPYGIGTVTYHWVDAGRPEILSADSADHRELMAQVWYPTRGVTSSRRAPYVQDASALSAAESRMIHLPAFALTHFSSVTTNAVPAAPMAHDEPDYPVLIYLTGFSGFRQVSTFQVEELVSHGYVVIGLDQPYAAASVVFPDGRQVAGLSKDQMDPLVEQSVNPVEVAPAVSGRRFSDGIIPYLAQDAVFTVDQVADLNRNDPNGIVTGRLDLQRIGTFGVSLGGFVGAEACRIDSRIRACLVMDAAMPAAVVKHGLKQPSMWITRDADTMRLERRRSGGWTEKDITEHQTTMRAVYSSLPGDGYFVQVPGMFHVNLTDLPSWSPLMSRLGLIGPIDPDRAHAIVNAYSLAFFDRHLKGIPSPLLNGPSRQYPDVILKTRRPH